MVEADFGGRPLTVRSEKYGATIRNRITGTIAMIVIVDLGGYSIYTPSEDGYSFLPHSEVGEWDVIIE